MPTFEDAVKEQSKLRLALYGPAGGGKTMTMLLLGLALAGGDPQKLGVIDSEHGSAAKYADKIGKFKHLVMERYSTEDYTDAITQALGLSLPAVGVDSFSHAWEGEGGILDRQTVLTEQNRGDSQTGWNKVKPFEKKLWNVVLSAQTHLIVTMRSRNTWVEGVNEKTGKKTREIVGLEPVQRKGSEYEFDVVAFMEPVDDALGAVKLTIEKTRYEQLPRGASWIFAPGKPELFEPFKDAVLASVNEGEPPVEATKAEVKLLTELLVAEGFEAKRIKDVLDGEKAKWSGVLPQRFVHEQTQKAINRAERKAEEAALSPEASTPSEPEPAA